MPGITMAETLGIFERGAERASAQITRPHFYNNIHVLAMQWQFPDSKNYKMNFDHMCKVFQKYGWNVQKKEIPIFTGVGVTKAQLWERKLQAEQWVERECVEFISNEVQDNDLVIVYYRGHGFAMQDKYLPTGADGKFRTEHPSFRFAMR